MAPVKSFVVFACLAVVFSAAAAHGDSIVTLTLNPAGGAISGAPGSTVGWGFTLTDLSSSDFVVPTNSDFCPDGLIASPCPAIGHPSVGVYSDIISGSVFDIGPEESVTQDFDSSIPSGFGSATMNVTANIGDTTSGELVLYYDVYDGDPLSSGSLILTDQEALAPASILVVASERESVPEPASLLLFVTGVVALIRRRSWTIRE